MTKLEFWKLIQPLVTELHDGHTGLGFPYEFRQNYLDNQGKIFPFNVKIHDDHLYVLENLSSDSAIGVNDEILSINGIPAQSILNEMRKYESGERKSFVNLKVERRFKPHLWSIYDFGEKFNLVLRSYNYNVEYSTVVPGITLDEYDKLKETDTSGAPSYSFYEIPNENIGVIDFRRMVDAREFRSFLKNTFQEIEKKQIGNLILDIRKNGGGNSSLVNDLFKYITRTPYTQATEMWVKISPETKESFKNRYIKWYIYPIYPFLYFVKYAKPLLFGEPGTLIKYYNEPRSRKINEPFFEGDVYLLTGPQTFSSANILADVFKCYGLGTIIGEETGGLTVAFGDIISFRLPYTKLKGYCSFKKFVHPCGKEDGRGVIPDIIITQSPKDLTNNKDTVMEFTVQYIRDKN